MRIIYRPLPGVWPSGQRTPWNRRQRSPFSSTWTKTMELLQRELRHLGVSPAASVVFEADYRESDIRIDGLPRANARTPDDPAIVISFESKHGPLRYGCDAFTSSEANIRAIALALEALRKVDRYGVTKRGEQYAGWKALPASTMSGEEARAWLREQIDPGQVDGSQFMDDDALLRAVAKRVHPDMPTGSRERWAQYERAKAALA